MKTKILVVFFVCAMLSACGGKGQEVSAIQATYNNPVLNNLSGNSSAIPPLPSFTNFSSVASSNSQGSFAGKIPQFFDFDVEDVYLAGKTGEQGFYAKMNVAKQVEINYLDFLPLGLAVTEGNVYFLQRIDADKINLVRYEEISKNTSNLASITADGEVVGFVKQGADMIIIVSSASSSLFYKYNANGTNIQVTRPFRTTALFFHGSTTYIGSESGDAKMLMRLNDAFKPTLSPLWSTQKDAMIKAGFASDNAIYLSGTMTENDNGFIFVKAFGNDGKTLWTQKLPAVLTIAPFFVHATNDTVYVAHDKSIWLLSIADQGKQNGPIYNAKGRINAIFENKVYMINENDDLEIGYLP